MRSARAFVFDADGVVIESWGFANVLNRKYRISTETTRSFFKGPFQSCLVGEADLRESLTPFLDQWGWTLSVDDFIELWLSSDNQPRDEVLNLIQKYRESGVPCFLASNQEPVRAAYIRDSMNFQSYFDDIFFSCDFGIPKPSCAFFRNIEEKIKTEPGNIWFWDDQPKYVAGATAAGWNAILYDSIESITDAT